MDQEYIDELKLLLTSAKHPRVKDLLQKALSETKPKLNGEGGAGDSILTPISKQKDRSISMVKISNYGWDQSDKFVKIYISDIKGIDKLKTESIRSEFNQKFIKVELLDVCGKNYGLTINDLHSAIYPDKCSVKVKSGMVIVNLCKAKNDNWQCLTAREKRLKDSKERKPPSLDGDDKEDPGQGLMKLMKQMYDDGDDEMKRTISKSWYESQQKKMNSPDGMMDM